MANPYANIGPQTNTSKPILNTDQKNPYAEIGPSSRTFNVTSEGPEFLDGRSDEANPYLTIGPQDIDGNPNWWDNLSYGFGMGFGDTARGLTQMFGGEKTWFSDQTLKQQQAELYARMQTDDGVWAMLGYFGGAILDPVTWLIPVAKAKNILEKEIGSKSFKNILADHCKGKSNTLQTHKRTPLALKMS